MKENLINDLNNLKLLASGGQADIYELPDGKLLRLLRKPEDAFLVSYEVTALRTVRANGLHAPEAYEEVNLDGRPGFIMERSEKKRLVQYIAYCARAQKSGRPAAAWYRFL